MRAAFAFFVVLLGLGAIAAYLSAFIVRQTEQAIVLEFGRPIEKGVITKPGLHWKIPIAQTVDYFDKRILDLDTSPQEVIASDQKRLVVDAFARFRITDPLEFYKTVAYRGDGAGSSRRVPGSRHPRGTRCGNIPGCRA